MKKLILSTNLLLLIITTLFSQCPEVTSYPYTESFTTWPPNCFNLTGGTSNWQQYNNNTAYCNFWSNNNATYYMVTPLLNLTDLSNPYLTFKWSHLYDSYFPNDKLTISSSQDGISWNTIWEKTGSSLNSNDGASTFSPGTYVTESIQLTPEKVYLRFIGNSGWGGNLFIDEIKVSDEPVPVTPTIQANTLAVSNISSSSITISWQNGDGSQRIVFIKEGNSNAPIPIDNSTYNANSIFKNGTQIDISGWYCIYKGTGSTCNVSELIPQTTYRIMVLEYNGMPGMEKYLTSVAIDNPIDITTSCDRDWEGGTNPKVHFYYQYEGCYNVNITVYSIGTCTMASETKRAYVVNDSITVYFDYGSLTGTLSSDGNNVSGTYYYNRCNGIKSGIWSATRLSPIPLQPSSITGASSLCVGDSAIYTVTNESGITYTWIATGGIVSGNRDSVSVKWDTVGSQTLTVVPSNSCWDGPNRTLNVTVNTIPSAAGSITGNTTVCKGESNVIYTVSDITGATSYVWTLPTGATGSSTTNSISVSYDNTAVSGDIKVKGQNDCGDGSESTLAITVNTIPSAAGSITGNTTV
ncbi:hypothetical protein ACFLTE_08995, partial [Bacteroidota bacterium]